MVIVIARRAVDRWFDHGRVKHKTMKLVFRVPQVSAQQSRVSSMNYCSSTLALCKSRGFLAPKDI